MLDNAIMDLEASIEASVMASKRKGVGAKMTDKQEWTKGWISYGQEALEAFEARPKPPCHSLSRLLSIPAYQSFWLRPPCV